MTTYCYPTLVSGTDIGDELLGQADMLLQQLRF
jgi:hypothetical protein